MARQTGIFRFKGKMGGLDFYQSEGVDMVRTKTGPTTQQYKNSPEYEGSRQASNDFGTAGGLAGKLKHAIIYMYGPALNPHINSKLTGIFTSALAKDKIHQRGERKIFYGDVSKLEGINFTANTNLRSTLGRLPVFSEIEKGKSFHFDFGGILTPPFTEAAGSRPYQVIIGLVALSEDSDPTVEWQESGMLEAGQKLSDLGQMELSFEGHQIQKVILGIVGIKFFDVVNGQTYSLKEGGAIGVVGCFVGGELV
ncbi:hypothetical protein [Cognataquiflexum rubidum]|uniref:hypothetical protein n=1 Tax=Cognataquiflexum rubidum TaxID=2922273 RepID=UPI001F13DFEF|nr:hypothetical protein [Cognataquiflexum rubidum]MCH6236117.1 hypothetical protein [Cognataquiflexum rubidum]